MRKRKKKDKKRAEITIDIKGKSLLYNPEDIEQTKGLLSKIPDIRQLKYNESNDDKDGTTSKYLNFNLHGVKYKIRMSDYIYKTFNNSILKSCRFVRNNWIIEASIYKYTPTDILDIIKNIDRNTIKYESIPYKDNLKKFVIQELNDKYNQDMNDADLIEYLVDTYIEDRNILDDKYNTEYYVLKNVVADILRNLDIDFDDD